MWFLVLDQLVWILVVKILLVRSFFVCLIRLDEASLRSYELLENETDGLPLLLIVEELLERGYSCVTYWCSFVCFVLISQWLDKVRKKPLIQNVIKWKSVGIATFFLLLCEQFYIMLYVIPTCLSIAWVRHF